MSDVVDLFLELAAIPSPPGEERAVADRVAAYLRDLGLDGRRGRRRRERSAATTGNLYARLEPTAEGTPLFLCAHLDTVPPDGPDRAGRSRTGSSATPRGTILGADNKAAVAAMLEAVARSCSPRAARTRASSSCSRRRRRSG